MYEDERIPDHVMLVSRQFHRKPLTSETNDKASPVTIQHYRVRHSSILYDEIALPL